ncbi:hypothetical protein RJ639_033785 [Escallonia herrerae]|uniref:Trypsin-like serine protease n=1 Tax=Escallonia herrerae TaxID=1293975 RepID=A0AA88WWC6_9ASTE|nr:hypothetical protein RJ639_033785 [Escallonia herrerae]
MQNPLRVLRGTIARASSPALLEHSFLPSKCVVPSCYLLATRGFTNSQTYTLQHAYPDPGESPQDRGCEVLVIEPQKPMIFTRTPEIREVAPTVSPTVVNVYYRQGCTVLKQGAGTIIDPSGIIVTVAHLMPSREATEDLKKIEIKTSASLQAATLGKSRELCLGDVVFSAGLYNRFYDDGLPRFKVEEGRYIGDQGGMLGKLLRVTCSIIEGDEGGPLFNRKKEVVGIMSGKESSSSCGANQVTSF